MPSTACYYAANQGDNPCKPVTDSLIPVYWLRSCFFVFVFFGGGLFFVCLVGFFFIFLVFAAIFSLHSLIL